ncbi:hypothetical protein TCAL_09394 [Tigriopus californicus]|uniref:Cytochrome b561 domain-containing protein n=2 Tax=Tigriopus californicus TaxID=6832 RepID=A0A553NTN9_TIGCA|nr:hypothetical protein TCAL_09394 [Tigriopus californicus]
MPLEIVGLIVGELSPRDLMRAFRAFSNDSNSLSENVACVIADTFCRKYYCHTSSFGQYNATQVIEESIKLENNIKESFDFDCTSIKHNYNVNQTEIDWNGTNLAIKNKADSKVFVHSTKESPAKFCGGMKLDQKIPKNCFINTWRHYSVLICNRSSNPIQVWTILECPTIVAKVLELKPLRKDLKPANRRLSIFGEILEFTHSDAILITLDIFHQDIGAIRTFSLPNLELTQTIGFPGSLASSLLTLKVDNSGQTHGYQLTLPPGDRCFAMDVLPNGDVYGLALSPMEQKFQVRQFQFQCSQGNIHCEVNALPTRKTTLAEKSLISSSGSWSSSDLESYEPSTQLRFCHRQRILILVLYLNDHCTVYGLSPNLDIRFSRGLSLGLDKEQRIIALAVNSTYFAIAGMRQDLIIIFFDANTGVQVNPKPVSVPVKRQSWESNMFLPIWIIFILGYPITVRATNPSLSESFYNGCGETKGCIGSTEGCVEEESCTVAMSYMGVSKDSYMIEIYGERLEQSSLTFLGVGLSLDQAMKDDSIMACSFPEDDANPRMEMYLAWRQSPRPVTADRLENPTLGITAIEGIVQDGWFMCSFKREANLEIPQFGEGKPHLNFDLNSELYHILFARGEVDPEKEFVIKKHQKENRMVTPTAINLGEFNPFTETNQFYFDCFQTKGCFGFPEGCVERKNCDMAFSYSGWSEGQYSVEMMTVHPEEYVAVAFSEDNIMGDDSALVCVADRKVIERNWNKFHGSKILERPQQDITGISVSEVDGVVLCTAQIQSQSTISSPFEEGTSSINVDLNQISYYIQMAKGPYIEDEIQHHSNKTVSDAPINLADFNNYFGASEVYDGCFEDGKGCFGIPLNCEDTKSCEVLFTYESNDREEFDMTVSGKIDGDQYLAAAISVGNKMGDNNAMICYASNDKVDVMNSWNTKNPYSNVPLEDTHLGLSQITGTLDDGYLTCKFKRKSNLDIPVPSGEGNKINFNLATEKYFLMLAKGSYTTSTGSITIEEHDMKDKSAELIDLTEGNRVKGGSKLLIKLHGSLMVLAWIFLASVGTFTARYCKKDFGDKKVLGKDLWFPIHQVFMTSTWVIGISAVVIIFVESGVSPLGAEQIKANPHGLIGLLATILMFIQPFMALLRCGPTHQKRIIFNIAHSLVGFSALGLAFAAIVLTTVDSFTKINLQYGVQIACIVFLCYFGVAHILMNIRLFAKREEQWRYKALPFYIFLVGCLVLTITIISLICLS